MLSTTGTGREDPGGREGTGAGEIRLAYKLLRVRQDQSLGPLFINRRQVIPVGQWLAAEAHPTKGFAFRPGWHASHAPRAPHLSTKGREWYAVAIKDYVPMPRPARQGGMWYLAQRMKVLGRAYALTEETDHDAQTEA